MKDNYVEIKMDRENGVFEVEENGEIDVHQGQVGPKQPVPPQPEHPPIGDGRRIGRGCNLALWGRFHFPLVSPGVFRRMLDPYHPTKLKSIEAGLRVLGKRLVVTVEDAA